MSDGYDDVEFYRTLASDEVHVEVLPVPQWARKRKRPEDAAPRQDGPGADPVLQEDEEDDHVQVVLCDQGPRGGGMAYYLERRWEVRQAIGDLLADPGLDAQTGAIVPLEAGGGALVPLAGPAAGAGPEPEEDVEATLAKIQFQMDFQEMADTPWRQVGANLQEHFNFDLDERGWKEYILRQIRIRLEARRRQRMGSHDRRALRD